MPQHKVKYSVRADNETSFLPFTKAVLDLHNDHFEIGENTVQYQDIGAAELTTRYQMLIPNRILWVSAEGKMYTIGPISKKLMGTIPFEYESVTIRSFWLNELYVLLLVLLIVLQFLN